MSELDVTYDSDSFDILYETPILKHRSPVVHAISIVKIYDRRQIIIVI